ncbi:MAG: hypothetical protein ACLFPL_05815 [Candidatus Nanoarchaeia archaeon]
MSKEVKLYLFLFTGLIQFQLLYALEISEINFRGDEFVEILIENNSIVDSFNESEFLVDDENSQNNTFSLYKSHSNTSTLLIVGSNFIDTYENNDSLELSDLNCQIYMASGTGVGYSGLKVGGEAFTIHFNSNLTLSYDDNYDTPDDEGDSLHFNSTSHFIDKNSPCELNEFQNASKILSEEDSEIEENSTQTNSPYNESLNETSQNDTPQQNSCDIELSLDVEEVIEEDKISFQFFGNTSLGVTYKVEDGVGNVVKNPFTSSTTSAKSYTPRKNGKFIVFGEIELDNCTKQVNQTTYFYNQDLDQDNDESSSSSPRVKRDSFIEIYQVIQNGYNQVKLIGELSRGESNSYRVSVNVNDERVAQFDVGKYGNFDFQIPLTLEPGEHEIEVRGFGERDVVDVEIADVMGELEERLVTLSQINSNSNNTIEFDEEQMKNFIQSSDSVENQLTSDPSGENQTQINSTQLFNSTEQNPTQQAVFSQHFFSQNVGVLTMIGGVVLVAGAIIALR